MKYLFDFLSKNPLSKDCISNGQIGIFLNSLIKMMNIKSNLLEECHTPNSEMTLLYFALERYADDGKYPTAAQAAECLKVSAPSVSRTLKSLEEKKLIKRSQDKADRRAVRITVTRAGRARVDKLLSSLIAIMNGLQNDFSKEELETMASYHQRLLNSIEKAVNERSK